MTERSDIPRGLLEAMSTAGEAVIGIGADGRITLANEAARTLLGGDDLSPSEEPYGHRFRLLDGARPDVDPIAAARAGTAVRLSPDATLVAGGDALAVTGTCVPWGESGGVLLLLHATHTDPASAALRVAQARLSEVQRTAHLGCWEIDLAGGEHYWSDELYRIFEADRATLGTTVEAFVSMVHPEDRDLVDRAFERSVREHAPYEVTHRIVTGSGRVRYVHSRGVLITDAAGRPLRSVGTLQDVTEQRAAEESVRFQATLMASVSEAVIATDRQFRIVAWNDAAERLYGATAAEALGRELPDLVDVTYRSGTRAETIEHLRNHGEWQGEVVVRRRDGRSLSILASVSNVRDPDGGFGGYVAVHRDVTRQRALERENAQLEGIKNLGRLAGGIAHDFNNALQAILGHAELARAALAPSDPAAADLDQVRAVAARSADLARHLQALAGEQVAQPIVMDLTAGVELAREAVNAVVGDAATVVWRLGRDLWTVRIDPAQIERLLLQLVMNAREAVGPQGGRIEIGTANADADGTRSFVMLTVRDNGIGMDAGTVDRAFQPLFSTKPGTGTTGLGLAIVAGIVRQNSGTIDIDSAPGKGTTVRVRLPRWNEPAAPAAAESLVAGDCPNRTILLVEDEEPVRRVTLRGLERAGFRVVSYGDPFEALEHVTRGLEPIDLLITDVMMPGLTGKQLVDRLLAVKPDLRYLYVSGYPADVIARQGVVDASIALLQKPFTLNELTGRVRRLLGSG